MCDKQMKHSLQISHWTKYQGKKYKIEPNGTDLVSSFFEPNTLGVKSSIQKDKNVSKLIFGKLTKIHHMLKLQRKNLDKIF